MTKSKDLVINIVGNSSDIQKDFKKLQKDTKKLQENLKKTAQVSAVAFAGLTAAIVGTIKAFRADEQAAFRTEQVIKSTGKAAGLTAEEISKMSQELQDFTTFAADAIQSGANLLLTFTKIGKETFPRATEVMLDMATAMGTGLKESAIQLGKALNDPVLGVSALTRVGVQFTEQQKAQIKVFVETNEIAKAQAIILKELETQMGGAAKAAAQGTGAFIQLNEVLGNIFSKIGENIFKRIEPFVQKLKEIAINIRDGNPRLIELTSNLLFFGTALTAIIGGLAGLGLALKVALVGLAAIGTTGAIVIASLTAIGAGIALVIKNMEAISAVITAVQASFEVFTNFLTRRINDILIAVNKAKIAYRELGITIAEATPGGLLDKFAERQKKLVDDLINENVRLRKDNRETAKSFEEIYDAIDAEKAKEKIQKQNQVIQEERQKANAQEIEDQKAQNERKLQLEEEQRQILAERKQLDREIEAAEKELALEQELEGNELEKERLRSDKRLREADRKDKKFKIEQQKKFNTDTLTAVQTLEQQKKFNTDTLTAVQTLSQNIIKDGSQAQKALFLITKAGAIADVAINTARAVTRALASAEPPRSFILAGITAAKGAIQAAAVASTALGARDGALVGDGSPNMARGDRVPFMLERGELVVPRRNFDEVVTATARSRGFTETTASGDRDIMVQIDLTDNAAQILTADQFENTTLGTDRA
jgi:hypothetical protein